MKQNPSGNMDMICSLFMHCEFEKAWSLLESADGPKASYLKYLYFLWELPPCRKDTDQEEKWLRQAAREGCPLAVLSLSGGSAEKRREMMEALEKESDSDALSLYFLGEEALQLKKGKAEAEKGIRLLEKSARLGFWGAMNELGYYYSEGKNKDDRKAFQWFLKGAAAGWPDSLFHVGECYELGLGTAKDPAKAALVYEQAARLGSGEAACALAVLYDHGTGVAEDPQKAFNLYKKAVELGDEEAEKAVGDCYFYGRGVKADKKEAGLHYHRAYDHGSMGAAAMIAVLMNEKGDAESRKEAFQWMRTSALGGNSDGMTGLGEYYLQGVGTRPDPQKGAALAEDGSSGAESGSHYGNRRPVPARRPYGRGSLLFSKSSRRGLGSR